MQSTPSQSIAALEAIAARRRIVQGLHDAFGVRFALRMPAEPWTELPIDEQDEQYELSGALPASFAVELSNSLTESKGRTLAAPAGEQATVVAVRLPPSIGLIATAIVPSTDRDLVTRLADAAVEKLALAELVKNYQCELDGCLAQIGEDFEELTFLRKLCEYLDMVHLHHGPNQVAELVLSELAPLIHAEALMLLLARQTGDAEHVAGADLRAVRIGKQLVTAEECYVVIHALNALSAHRPVVNNHLDKLPEGSLVAGVRQVIIAPLLKRESVLGWLVAINRSPSSLAHNGHDQDQREFGSVQASLLASVASMLATHTNNVELFRQRETLLVSVVRSMVSAIDAKDHYTRGHSERVALVARALALRLKLTQDECERIYLAGLLHDIGKIGISDAVLHKPDRLTADEFDQIKGHPDQGWAILKDLDQLAHILPGVLHHHERYDGRGYPDRLAAEAIPLTARILAVADAYDAMCSDRPYRQGMPLAKVEEILRGGSGSHWDPAIVGALLEAMPEIAAVWRQYQEPATPQRCSPAPGVANDFVDAPRIVAH